MNPNHRPIPVRDPITQKPLMVTELQTEDGELTVRSRFAIPPMMRLDEEQYHFLETFLRCRGMLNAVERELGISYPTVRARLDSLLDALALKPVEKQERSPAEHEAKLKILEQLERGEIDAEQAKTQIRGSK